MRFPRCTFVFQIFFHAEEVLGTIVVSKGGNPKNKIEIFDRIFHGGGGVSSSIFFFSSFFYLKNIA